MQSKSQGEPAGPEHRVTVGVFGSSETKRK